MNFRYRTLLHFSVSVLLAASLGAAAVEDDHVNVRLDVGGRTFAGQLVAVATADGIPTSQPTNVPPPADASIPSIETAGGDAPFAVHLNAADAIDPTTLRETRVHWDFGDTSATTRFNAIDGYNAAHIYDTPGTYTIARTVESPAGKSSVRVRLTVKPANRTAIYVSADGNDQSDGSSPQKALKTWARALAAIGPNVELRFRRGDRFVVDRAAVVRADNVCFTAFGDATQARPALVIERQLPGSNLIDASGKRLLIEDLSFDAPYFGADLGKANLPDLIHPSGDGGVVIRRCEFRDENMVVNGNSQPHNVALIDNDLPLETGLRSYFTWIEGANWTLLGNHVANSTREHCVRVGGSGGTRINIQFNDFNNLDRTAAAEHPDKDDNAKAALNIQKGSVLYVAHNHLRGANGVGPLGKADGLGDKGGRWVGAVVEYNRIDGFIEVKHGASFITYRDNVIRCDDWPALPLDGFDSQYGRGVSDVWIEHNAIIDGGTKGDFLWVQPGALRLHVIANLYVAPDLAPGAYQTAAMYVTEPDLRAFAEIRGNVWPTGRPNAWAQNGVHYVAANWGEQAGYRDPAEWAAMRPPVQDDRFENVTDLTATSASGGAGVEDASALPALTASPSPAPGAPALAPQQNR